MNMQKNASCRNSLKISSEFGKLRHNSSDLLVNEFVLSGLPAALLCCEGMLSTSTITELILRPIVEIQLEHPTAEQIFQHIQKHQLFSTDRAEALNYRDLFRFLNSGFAVLVLDGCPKALVFGVQGYDKRSVSTPSGENNIFGAKDGFVGSCPHQYVFDSPTDEVAISQAGTWLLRR